MESKWRSELSYADRFAIISDLVFALQASPNNPLAEARNQAKSIEKNLYINATSREEYNEACGHKLQKLKQIEGAPAVQDVDENEIDFALSSAAVSIGKYTHAIHHRDGLFSFVYKAWASAGEGSLSQGSGTLVALKVTTPSMMEEPHDSEREARILKACQHDHIIHMLDAFSLAGGRLVLTFPFMLFDLEGLLTQGRLSHTRARSHLRDMFSALGYLHAAGIIHRDVKPSNILLNYPDGPAYLADFGIAWSPNDLASEDADNKITDVGTTSYRPPELLFGNMKYGCTLDLWAAGCVVAEVTSLGKKTLFDSGDLGSELALIQSIFKSLGTPTLETWPEAVHFRDWGKMQFKEYPAKPWSELLPQASHSARSLVGALVRYESKERLTACEALKHAYFTD